MTMKLRDKSATVCLVLLCCAACAPVVPPVTAVMRTEQGARVRVCEPQVSVVPFPGVDADTVLALAAAIEYINGIGLGPEWIFADVGRDSTLYVQVRTKERKGEGADTHLFWDPISGCVLRAEVLVDHRVAALERWETAMRHELLHVLGLWHSNTTGELMSHYNAGRQHPLELTEGEVRSLGEVYAPRQPAVAGADEML